MLSDWFHCSLGQQLLCLPETRACYELVMDQKLQERDVDGKGKRKRLLYPSIATFIEIAVTGGESLYAIPYISLSMPSQSLPNHLVTAN